MKSSPLESTLIMSTCPKNKAKELAYFLVQNRFAACVNLASTVTSIYLWKDEICEEQESVLLIKTAQSKAQACIHALQQKHPYDVPEIISFPIDTQMSLQSYLDWIQSSTIE